MEESESIGDASGREFPPMKLPAGVTEDYINCQKSCGLNWHVLKAGTPGKPLVLFCHGYPELAYSWRKIIGAIAEAGYYCVAMDQRGYGRTTSGFLQFPANNEYYLTNLVRDLVCLVYKLGYTKVLSIVGHDFGAVSSAMAALMRPDMFRSTVQLSHPHHPSATPQSFDGSSDSGPPKNGVDMKAELEKLDPPRKHYKLYNTTPEAEQEWNNPPQGLEKFLRGYLHLKSADWTKNDPHPLETASAEALAEMPEYYIMRKEDSMPATVERNMENEDYTKTEKWLTTDDLEVYCTEWKRTGFGSALKWYGSNSPSQSMRDMLLFAGKRIEVPCTFISGKQDWGNYQSPGDIEGYEDPARVKEGCFRGTRLIPDAGHWVQQEQPEAVVVALLEFLKTV
ncbi:Alpha/Beta hydrolase protein [Xylariaceae sp. FL1019]|nr:Alpha/Beta hydrolase protein [Xylariaceae sp. FL1019]